MFMETTLKFVPPGGYRACANCAASKAKCIRPDDGNGTGKCERCLRLGKECHINPRAKKKRRLADPKALTWDLQSVPPPPQENGDLTRSSSSSTPRALQQQKQPPKKQPPPPLPLTDGDDNDPVFAELQISDAQAEEILRLFRHRQEFLTPFVELAPNATAMYLRREKPMIFLAIMMASSYHDLEQQNRLTRLLMAYISEQLFKKGCKSLQLLQGVLVFANWYGSQIFVSPQITNLLHVAMALTTDLGLDKAPTPMERFSARALQHPHSPEGSGHTIEERRALVACFYLSSTISTSINMLTALQYSAQVEDACKLFERSDPLSQDHRLAKLARLQYITSKIYQMQKDADLGGDHRIAVAGFVKNFRDELNNFWTGLPEVLRNDISIILSYHTAEIHLYKISLTDSPPISPADAIHRPSPAQEELQCSCLFALRAFFKVFFTFDSSEYFSIPMALFVQLAHADVTLAKLTSLWYGRRWPDRCTPDMLAFGDVMERLALRLEEAKTREHPFGWPMHNTVFDQWAERIRSFKALDFAATAPPKPPSRVPTPANASVVMAGPPPSMPSVGPPEPAEAMQADWAAWFDTVSASWVSPTELAGAAWPDATFATWDMDGAAGRTGEYS